MHCSGAVAAHAGWGRVDQSSVRGGSCAHGAEVGALPKGGDKVAVDDGVKVAIGSQPTDAFAADAARVKKYFHGTIDDVVIYSRALDEGEIGDLAGGLSPDLAVDPRGKLAIAWGTLNL